MKKAIGSLLCSIEVRFRCSFTLMILESNGFNRVHMDESVWEDKDGLLRLLQA